MEFDKEKNEQARKQKEMDGYEGKWKNRQRILTLIVQLMERQKVEVVGD